MQPLQIDALVDRVPAVRTGSHFAAKLNLALGALSVSRARLAAAVGVDKSLVGRWVSGAVSPSDHNLSRITAVVADRFPGFNALEWNRELADFAKRLGVDPVMVLPIESGPTNDNNDAPLFPFLNHAQLTTQRRGAAYEGFWRTSRPSVLMSDVIFQDHGMIRQNDRGFLEIRMGGAGLTFQGVMMLAEGNVFVILNDMVGQTPLFLVFRGVPLPKAELLEGILLMAALNPARTPAAVPILLERIGDLTGDRAADDAHCDGLILKHPTVAMEDVPEETRACLLRDVGPAAAALGGDMYLMATGATGLTRGTTITGQLRG